MSISDKHMSMWATLLEFLMLLDRFGLVPKGELTDSDIIRRVDNWKGWGTDE